MRTIIYKTSVTRSSINIQQFPLYHCNFHLDCVNPQPPTHRSTLVPFYYSPPPSFTISNAKAHHYYHTTTKSFGEPFTWSQVPLRTWTTKRLRKALQIFHLGIHMNVQTQIPPTTETSNSFRHPRSLFCIDLWTLFRESIFANHFYQNSTGKSHIIIRRRPAGYLIVCLILPASLFSLNYLWSFAIIHLLQWLISCCRSSRWKSANDMMTTGLKDEG